MLVAPLGSQPFPHGSAILRGAEEQVWRRVFAALDGSRMVKTPLWLGALIQNEPVGSLILNIVRVRHNAPEQCAPFVA